MTKAEFRSASALALVVGLRMFGLFLVLPVLAPDLARMPGGTPLVIGLALGIYGLGHLILQVPLGWLSDRIGRKPVITLGLLLFAAGSLLAALSSGVWGIVLGRALQGCGAISGVSQALAADLSSEDSRGAVMAILGAMVGLAFMLALLSGTTLAAHLGGLQGLFGLTFVLVLLAIAALWLVVPHAPLPKRSASGFGAMLASLRDARLALMGVSALVLHGVLTLFFVAMPLLLLRRLDIHQYAQWRIYVPALLAAALVMGAVTPRLRSRQATVRTAQASVLLLLLGLAVLALLKPGMAVAVVGAILFFVAFSMLEATLPSLVSRLVTAQQRGAALGAYSAAQFVGVLIGGIGGGALLHAVGMRGVLLAGALAVALWLLLMLAGGGMLLRPAPAENTGAD